jgi:hypothetical protein
LGEGHLKGRTASRSCTHAETETGFDYVQYKSDVNRVCTVFV